MKAWFEKTKGAIIALIILGLVLCLFLASGWTRADYEIQSGDLSGEKTLIVFMEKIGDVPNNVKVSFSEDNISAFLVNFRNVGIFYLAVAIVILIKATNKKEYENIEYGSADWCTDKEAYTILSRKEGMILGAKKYMPMLPAPPAGKNGNILVIRRFWFG